MTTETAPHPAAAIQAAADQRAGGIIRARQDHTEAVRQVNQEYADTLRALMATHGISMAEVGRLLKVSRQSVDNILRRHPAPPAT